MSYSSKLIALDTMMQYLVSLNEKLLSEQLTLSEFLDISDLLAKIRDVVNSYEGISATIYVEDGQEAPVSDADISFQHRDRSEHRLPVGDLIFELPLVDFLGWVAEGGSLALTYTQELA